MNKKEVINGLSQILVEIKEDKTLTDKLSENSNLINDVGIDSLQMISLMINIEEKFSVELNFSQINLDHLNSIGSLADFILQQKKIEE